MGDAFFSKITEEEAKELERPYDEWEIWVAIKDCGGNKSPGPDGFTFGFLRKFWETIKLDLLSEVKWFGEKGAISEGCNSSFLTLIPKNDAPLHLRDYRPISLIGVFYKIVAKLLAERIKRVMGKIIDYSQNAFIKGRYILDGILIANETVDYVKKKEENGAYIQSGFRKSL